MKLERCISVKKKKKKDSFPWQNLCHSPKTTPFSHRFNTVIAWLYKKDSNMKNKRQKARLERQKMWNSLSALHAHLIQ